MPTCTRGHVLSATAGLLSVVALSVLGCSSARQTDPSALAFAERRLPAIPGPASSRIHIKKSVWTGIEMSDGWTYHERPVPGDIVEKADAFLASRLGEAHARDWMTYLPDESVEVSPLPTFGIGWCRVCYRFHVPTAPFVDMTVQVVLDEEGNCDESRSTPIPDCAAFPQDCEFSIDEKEAREIAASLGLPGGADAYSAQFDLRLFTGYVWHVCGVADEPEDTEHQGMRHRRCLEIDARTGSRISYVSTGQWVDVFGHPIAPN